ncbi:MAG TPA: hypothetical protein VGF95_13460 [Solirubrobacteraceae bacterium]|jgi:4-diphosphocytidyl-2-C-methyl-D-erythritol kinase
MSFAALSARAPAKINLGLFVGTTRTDGRHELVSVMQSISLCDELTLTPAAPGSQADELHCPGVDGPPEGNLALRALTAFRSASGWEGPPALLQILKRVPVAAGLGGGSADAAAALRLAATASGLDDERLLLELAGGLGADVPAQVQPGSWLAEGVGERLTPLPGGAGFGVLVLPSQKPLSTAAVYGELDRVGPLRGLDELGDLSRALREAFVDGTAALPPPQLLHNDLQAAAIRLDPTIELALGEAHRAGAEIALLSGSGPTVLGLFSGVDGPTRARHAAEELRGRMPAALAAVPVDAGFGRVQPPHHCATIAAKAL